MDEEEVSNSHLIISKEKNNDISYPMYFGVTCAFLALRILCEPDKEDKNGGTVCNKMLQRSAQLLGLLAWSVQREGENLDKCELQNKLESALREIEDLKKLRHEDAKANEKVVGIFASQEQSWLTEKKKLHLHIEALMRELRGLKKMKDENILELDEKVKEMESLVKSKDEVLEEEVKKTKELEEKLKTAENSENELRETLKKEGEDHATEIRKHRTAFIELVSNHRQLEAEMGRALRQVEVTRQELDLILEQKEESELLGQKLSIEIVKLRKDLDQKDKILSAMMRKSKSDLVEKQALLKDIKLSKAKKKQAELEMERWVAVKESKHERHSLRSMFTSSRLDISSGAKGILSHTGKSKSQQTDYSLEWRHLETKNELDVFSPISEYYSAEGYENLDTKRFESWVCLEAEKRAAVIEKRHHSELEAFAEQMRNKDEKLEGYRWRLISMEIESKRLQSYVEGLNQNMSKLRHENMKLETMLAEREEEINSMKEQFASQLKPFTGQRMINSNASLHDPALTNDTVWSKVKIVKKRGMEKEQEKKTTSTETSPEDFMVKEKSPACDEPQNVSVVVESPEKELEEQKEVVVDDSVKGEKLASSSDDLGKVNCSTWRLDIHALGVTYKIKRLKQQLLLLERLTGKTTEKNDNEENETKKGFVSLMSLLNKQVCRYHSLQGKADDLCKRMHEISAEVSGSESNSTRRKSDTKKRGHFLEETFQLQRYIVATGQKLMEIQSKIEASGFTGVAEELNDKSVTFDKDRFAENVKSLFQDVQRGLEVRIARIIGDLEGNLACEGMVHLRRGK